MGSKNSLISKLARNLDATGDITADAIASTVSLGAKIYASRANLPSSGNTAGDQAYVTDNNRLYIWNGSGWYNVALLNVAPAISSVTDSDGGVSPFSLSTTGAVTTITITAADSDGDPITYTATADSNFAGLGTVSQADNVFTVTPFSSDSATTESGTITFTATDGVNVASSGVQTFTLNFLSQYWDETVLSIGTSSTNSLDNSTFIDRSTNAYTVTTNGAPVQTAFHPYLDNWSVKFDGTTDWLTVPSSTDFAFGTGDFTVEAWVWSDNNRTTYGPGTIFDFRSQLGTESFSTRILENLGVRFYDGPNGLAKDTTSGHFVMNAWNHIAVTRQSGTLDIWINGISRFNGSVTTNYGTSGWPIRIGGNWSSGYDMDGYISNFRAVKGTAVYTSTFTPSTEKLTAVSGISILTCQSNRYVDNSGNGHTFTTSGTPTVSAFNPFGQLSEYAAGANKGSVYLNGSSSIDGGASINPSSGCCIEGWAYVTTVSSYAFFFSTEQGNAGFYPRWYVGHDNSGNWRVSPGDATDNNLTSYPVTKNQWNHWALTNDGSTSRLFVNGKLIYTKSVTPTSESLNFNISKYGDTLQYTTYGYISDFRAATTIPTAYQTSSTTLDTQVFTSPTSPGGASGAGYYLPMDNAGIYNKTGNEGGLTLAGNTATSTTQTKYATTSVYFDGTGDTLILPSPVFTTSDFTIEFWLNTTQTSSTRIAGNLNSAWSAGDFVLSLNDNAGKIGMYVYAVDAANEVLESTTSVNDGSWHHIAYTRSGSNWYLFVDGTSESTATSATSFGDTSADILTLGFDGYDGTGFNGYLENFQILKNIAKYTTNFTPPTQTQGRNYQAES